MPVRKDHDELTVITKTYDFILWSCHHTGKFPRNHRFVLGERIERYLYDLLETLIRAKYTKHRQELLEQANLVLEILRFQIRLAKDLQCLKVESYGFAAKSIDEIVASRFGQMLPRPGYFVDCRSPKKEAKALKRSRSPSFTEYQHGQHDSEAHGQGACDRRTAVSSQQRPL